MREQDLDNDSFCQPTTVTAAFSNALRQFCLSDASQTPNLAQLRTAMSETLGIPLAPGIIISHSTQTPALHLHRLPLHQTLKSIEDLGSNLAAGIKKYQKLEAESPSKEALRVLGIVLRKLTGEDKEQQGALKVLFKEALEIDLLNPQIPSWNSQTILNIDGVKTLVTIKLNPDNLASKSLAKLVGSDLSNEAKKNNYSYKFEFKDLDAKDSEGLINLKNKWRYLEYLACYLTPPACVALAGNSILSSIKVPELFSNPILQGVLNKSIELLPFGIAVVGAHLLYQKMSRNRAK